MWQSRTVASLRVALVQHASGLEPDANRALVAELAPDDADLIVFPEAFARDFGEAGSDVSAYAEPLDGPFATEVARVAEERGATVVAGMFEPGDEPDRPFNTLVTRGAVTAAYRTIHLYDSFGYQESARLVAGPVEPVLVDVDGFRVGLMTCYDLRFPELARELVGRGAELLVVPAAWVAGPLKVDHWRTLARARTSVRQWSALRGPATQALGTTSTSAPASTRARAISGKRRS